MLILLGPVMSILLYLLTGLTSLPEEACVMAGIVGLMAFWWITEAIPPAITALLPAALFPLLGIMPAKEVTPLYMNDILLLFLGGFLTAIAIEKWHLHRRFAFSLIRLMGYSPSGLLAGIMLSAFFLSMWVSNTATTLMLLPTTLALSTFITGDKQRNNFAVAVLLGLAYAASIGGMATPVGTPTNLIFVNYYGQTYPEAEPIGFLRWVIKAFPLAISLLAGTYFLLRFTYLRQQQTVPWQPDKMEIHPFTSPERRVFFLFLGLIILWFTRQSLPMGSFTVPGWGDALGFGNAVQDGTVALLFAILYFAVPSGKGDHSFLLETADIKKIPYPIILFFGGGFAMAEGFARSGLSDWLGGQMTVLEGLPILIVLLGVAIIITLLSEIASNVATIQLSLPILAAIAAGLQIDPVVILFPATIAASFGFMLPVATAPNMIVYSAEKFHSREMLRMGFWVDLMGIGLIGLMGYIH